MPRCTDSMTERPLRVPWSSTVACSHRDVDGRDLAPEFVGVVRPRFTSVIIQGGVVRKAWWGLLRRTAAPPITDEP